MSNLIAITIGDIKGVGIHILLDTWKKKQIKNFILFTDIKFFKKYFYTKKLFNNINIISLNGKKINYNKYKFNIYTYDSSSLEDNTYKSLRHAYVFCNYKICIGLITLPLRKDLIKERINKNFIGHTEYYEKLDNQQSSNMILYHKKIIVSPLTTHIAINKIPKLMLDKKYIYDKIMRLHNSLKIDFNIKKPKLVISGLNPHAGENGNIGLEEIKILKPIIKKIRNKNIIIDGPLSADSILIEENLKKYDCFIFILHDQALIPFKYISKFTGVNYTGNLSIIRTSPDHGTAYNLIGSKKITNKSFINCYKLIKKIYFNRKYNVKT